MFPIFEKLGGEQAALELVSRNRRGAHANTPSALTLKRWRRIGLPAHVQTILAEEAEKRGVKFAYSDMHWRKPVRDERRA